ncbi:MAG: response regulator [Desulfotalea sp.]
MSENKKTATLVNVSSPLSLAQVQALVAGFSGQIFSVDLDLNVQWANWDQGHSIESPLKFHCCDLLNLTCLDCNHCNIAASIENREVRIGIREPKEGAVEKVVYEVISSPVIENDAVTGAIVIVNNITEKYRLEKRLRQNQKMEAIATLARGIGHDFNNVLTPIIGYAEIIKMLNKQADIKNDIYDDYMGEILVASRRAQSLIEQMLTFARSSEGRISLQYAYPIVKEVSKLLRTMLPATIKISSNIDESCGQIAVDQHDLHQMLMNLCNNAADAIGDEHGEIIIELYQVNDDVGELWACIVVSDTGAGISVSNLDKIFDPYFTTKEKEQGTGMGLSVVRGLVYSQGGKIEVDSAVDQGTTVKLLFPVKASDKSESNIIDSSDLERGHGHILLVDDEEQVASVTAELLKNLGYSVWQFTSPREALAVFIEDSEKYDLIMTDLVMPEITGVEFCSEVKKIRPNIPVILSTGYSEKITEETLRRVGIEDYYLKPISLKKLSSVVSKAISNK